jgi:LacI family transcriptional regulator
MPTRLRDIGDALGLSPATVSRALNGFPEVNEATRLRVADAAARLNYQPNQIARKLVSGRSDTVALVIERPRSLSTDTTFFHVVSGISAALAKSGVDLVLHVAADDDPVEPYRRLLAKGSLDGFILNAPRPDDPRIAFLTAEGAHFVVHGRETPDAAHAYFDIDNGLVSALAVDLLCDLGHERIGLINGPSVMSFAAQRRAAFESTLLRRATPSHPEFIFEGPMTESFGYTMALRALAGTLGPPPTAFVCGSTLSAGGAYRAVEDRGLRVGHDVSIVSHDDDVPDVPATAFSPALTVTRAPLTDACGPLADILLESVRGNVVASLQRVATPDLIVRASTGPRRD